MTVKTWVYLWAFCSVALVYVPVFMPVPGCFDYSGLVIQFDIRYCDPSCFVLLSQNCCSYSGPFMVPYKFLKCLFYICEICHGYFNRAFNLSAHQQMSGSKNYGTFTQWNSTQQRERSLYPLPPVWMELESIMLSEISQAVRDKYHMISPFTGT